MHTRPTPAGNLLYTKFLRRCARRWPHPWLRRYLLTHLRKLCVDEELVVWVDWGFTMAVSPRDYISHSIYFFGDYDAVMSNIMKYHIRQGQTVWDVGTERGWFSLLMARLVGEKGQVDSFEAFPPNFAKLEANIARNQMSWVRANGVAVSDTTGPLWFVPPSNEVTDNVGFLEHCNGVGFLTDRSQPGALQIPGLTLDAYAEAADLQRLDFIKMDVEGAEFRALTGAAKTLTLFRPIIAVEYSSGALRRAGSSLQELDALLDSYGYDRFEFKHWDYGGRFHQLDLKEWAHKTDQETVINVYCFPRNARYNTP